MLKKYYERKLQKLFKGIINQKNCIKKSNLIIQSVAVYIKLNGLSNSREKFIFPVSRVRNQFENYIKANIVDPLLVETLITKSYDLFWLGNYPGAVDILQNRVGSKYTVYGGRNLEPRISKHASIESIMVLKN